MARLSLTGCCTGDRAIDGRWRCEGQQGAAPVSKDVGRLSLHLTPFLLEILREMTLCQCVS